MFSEYASRFLAQSQSRISFRQPEESARSPPKRSRRRDQASARLPAGRSYLQRPVAGNPYQAAPSQFPFASRPNAPPAPLFHSNIDEFREEDDEEEHEREVEDFYALQRSRRQFVPARLDESSEADDDGSRASGLGESGDVRAADDPGARAGGIRSSWRGGLSTERSRKHAVEVEDVDENHLQRVLSGGSSDAKSHMSDVGLGSTMKSSINDDDPGHLAVEIGADGHSPSIQQFRKHPTLGGQAHFSPLGMQETEPEAQRARPPPPDSDTSSIPPTSTVPAIEPPRLDVFWGNLYLICLAAFFASFFLVYLHTSAPDRKHPLGDDKEPSVYTTLRASFHLLAVDTVVAIIVSLFWLALLRVYVRPLVYTILVAVPVILLSFSLYPFISSFHSPRKESSLQDWAMSWLSSVPAIGALLWVYGVYKGRHAFGKAIGILEFSCKILAANPALLVLGFATLAGVVAWTWLWMGMFTRVFLGGHLSTLVKGLFVIDMGTWWLGIFFVLVYLWTLGVGSAIQRATTAATVSQWYFHRLSIPAPSSPEVVKAALNHSTITMFGTICLSTLLALLVRLPLLVLPRRFVALVGFCSYTLLPNSVTILTHPITLTYSTIHSLPLTSAARAVSQLSFMSSSNPATAQNFRSRNTSYAKTTTILPYNLALLLLHSTRLVTSLAFGFGAWVTTAQDMTIGNVRGSLYAYIVGFIAGAIGWAVLGAMEGVLTGIVDAVVVCWASEVRNGEVKYCREAGWLLGDEAGGAEQEGLLRV